MEEDANHSLPQLSFTRGVSWAAYRRLSASGPHNARYDAYVLADRHGKSPQTVPTKYDYSPASWSCDGVCGRLVPRQARQNQSVVALCGQLSPVNRAQEGVQPPLLPQSVLGW